MYLSPLLIVLFSIPACHHSLDPGPVCYSVAPSVSCTDWARDGGPSAPPPQAHKAALPGDLPFTRDSTTQPIDLPTALRLADSRNPDVALARERIQEALARQEIAELLWLPNLEVGPSWARHDGQIQRANGEVFTTSRSSLFAGGGVGLSLQLSDALFAPLAARQVTVARQAGAAGIANENLLEAALAFIDLHQRNMELRINEGTLRNAGQLLKLTEDFEKAGKGAAADTARARTEVLRRQRQRTEIQASVDLSSARLVQLLQLPPALRLLPVDPTFVPIALVPEDISLVNLLSHAVANRPELAENRALILASLEAWRAAKIAPWLPNLRLAYASGVFGGGINDFLGEFSARGDFGVTASWQLQNLGLGNQALTRERHSQYSQAVFRQASVEAKVASQVVSSFQTAFAKRRELADSQREVASARDSYRLNEERIRRAPDQGRPIELLQAIQALAQARSDYLSVVADYNRAQFKLYVAVGNPPRCALDHGNSIPVIEPTVPPKVPTPQP